MKQRTGKENSRDPASGHHIPWLEWLASGTGFALAACVFGVIGWQALGDASSPPAIAVQMTDSASVTGGYRILFEARNLGGAAAAQVRIEGTLSGAGDHVETSSVILDYIPGQSMRKGGLFFTQDPQAGRLSLRAASFSNP